MGLPALFCTWEAVAVAAALGVSPADPQALDRYAYVRNNPLKYVDPTGLSNTPPPYFAPFDWEKLKQAGECLSSLGVPKSSHRGTLLLIARLQQGASPLTPVFYMGRGSGTYEGGVPVYIEAKGTLLYTGMKDRWTGTYSVRVRVDLPKDEFDSLCGCGTGYVYVYYSSDPPDRHIALDVKVDFSSGETRKAEFEGFEPRGNGNPPVGVYSFQYSESLGYPTQVRVKPRPRTAVDQIGIITSEDEWWITSDWETTIPVVPTYGGFLWP